MAPRLSKHPDPLAPRLDPNRTLPRRRPDCHHPLVRVLAVSGSLQARSSNRAILRTAHRVASPDLEIAESMSMGDVPAFNPDLERDGAGAPPAVVEWRAQVAAADGVLIASPEYAHSM